MIISMTKELNFESRTWVMVVKHVYTLKISAELEAGKVNEVDTMRQSPSKIPVLKD